MYTCKDKTIDLLNELKNVCDTEGIRYYLSGELVLFEAKQREISDRFNNGTIVVFAKDIERLTDILSKKEGRKVESLANNSKFPGFYVRYMDTNTTLINYLERAYTYETNSMGINIEIICGCSRNTLKKKILSKLKRVWVIENTPYLLSPRKRKRNFKDFLIWTFLRIAKHTPIMRSLFNAWIREGMVKTKRREIATTGGRIAKFDVSMFKGSRKTQWLPGEFRTVRRRESFQKEYFGRRKKIKTVGYDIYDLDVPWEEFLSQLNNNKISLKKYQMQEQRYLPWRDGKYFPMHRKREKSYSYMFCSEDRMLMYKEFKGEKKELVLSLYEQRDFIQLEEQLEEYIKKIWRYNRYKIGFCSDPEIFKIALYVMIYNAFNNTDEFKVFRKKANKILDIVRNTDYRHFDSIENAFWGELDDETALMEKKEQVISAVRKNIRSYFPKYAQNGKKRRKYVLHQ